MVLSDRRFTLLKDYLDTTSMTYLVGYADKFKQLTKDIINTESSLLRASKTMDGVDPGTLTPENTINDEQFRKLSKEDAEKRERNLDHYRNRKQELLKERDKFLSGEYSMPYAEKMLFAIDSDLNQSFMVMNYD
jgi:ribosomal protein S2